MFLRIICQTFFIHCKHLCNNLRLGGFLVQTVKPQNYLVQRFVRGGEVGEKQFKIFAVECGEACTLREIFFTDVEDVLRGG